ncbi:MAG: hypothetical protein P4M12_12400 [Gammaproteobacteria bacterium]|nr:hypothetical protein [Gammaproteobacteria bacterium]
MSRSRLFSKSKEREELVSLKTKTLEELQSLRDLELKYFEALKERYEDDHREHKKWEAEISQCLAKLEETNARIFEKRDELHDLKLTF